LPDFTYSYDIVGNILSRSYLSYQEGFGYDHLNRLMDVIAINDIMIDYEHVYTYDELGNIVERDTTKYEQLAAGPHAVTHVDNEQVFGYDANGNMITRTLGIDNYTQVFDIQNRLIEVVDNNTGDSTRFAYDASGQRVMTTRPDGSILYTPFPQFEEEVRPDYEGTGTDELIIGETGQVLVTNSWQTLTFNHNYRHPVVIAQPAERNETDSAVVRIFAVNDGSFRIRIHDAPGSPSGHVAELVNYIVVEAGHWRLADGTELEAGDQVTNATVGRLLTNSWADVTLQQSKI
jgi:YD repeat-containing protein